MHFEVRRQIARRPEEVWPLLIDRETLVSGGFGILKINDDIGPQAKIKLWSEASPKRAFPLKVTVFTSPREMVWEGGMPFGLFKGERRFSLATSATGTEFHMREDYSSPLLGLIGKTIPDLTQYFEKFGDALQRAAEGKI